MKPKVVVFSSLDSEVLAELRAECEVVQIDPKAGDVNAQIGVAVSDADGMIGVGRVLNADNLASACRLKVISSVSVGYDNYDLAFLNRQHIWLAHTPHVLTETTADLAFALLMAAARGVARWDAWVKDGQWHKTAGWAQYGQDIHGKTLGIVGLGNIGAAIARRGRFGFNMNIVYHNRRDNPALAEGLCAQYLTLPALLHQADFVVLAASLNADSRALMGADELALMPRHAVLVNIGRGALVDENALYQALKNETLFAAGLDVFAREPLQDSPLFALPNVVTLPHLGSATAQTRRAMARLALRNLQQGLRGEIPRYAINPYFN